MLSTTSAALNRTTSRSDYARLKPEMPNKGYAKGANFERAIKKTFDESGDFVVRSAGSKGPADLVVIDKLGEVTLIQCETGTNTKAKREALETAALTYNCNALMVKKGSKGYVWSTIRTKTDQKRGDNDII